MQQHGHGNGSPLCDHEAADLQGSKKAVVSPDHEALAIKLKGIVLAQVSLQKKLLFALFPPASLSRIKCSVEARGAAAAYSPG